MCVSGGNGRYVPPLHTRHGPTYISALPTLFLSEFLSFNASLWSLYSYLFVLLLSHVRAVFVSFLLCKNVPRDRHKPLPPLLHQNNTRTGKYLIKVGTTFDLPFLNTLNWIVIRVFDTRVAWFNYCARCDNNQHCPHIHVTGVTSSRGERDLTGST